MSDKEQRDSQNAERVIVNAFENATIHGLARIMQSQKIIFKIIWSLLLLASITYCTLCISRSIINYLSYPVITNIKEEEYIVTEFPSITVCNSDPMNTLHLSKMLLNCFFDDVPCNVTDFYGTDVYKDESKQTCYSFNFGKDLNGSKVEIRKLIKTGNGLSLEIFTGSSNISSHGGLSLHVHDSKGYRNFNDKISVPSGMETNIFVSKIETKLTPKPYSKCEAVILDKIPFDLDLIDQERIYSSTFCLDMCHFHKLKDCKSSNKSQASKDKCEYDVNQNYETIMATDCIPYCPIKCEKTDYDFQSSYLNFPISKSYFENFPKDNRFENYDFSFLKERVLKVNINLKGSKNTVIEITPKISLDDLISQIGGTLGCFIGASLLSLVEIGELFFKLILLIPKRIRKNRVVTKKVIEIE